MKEKFLILSLFSLLTACSRVNEDFEELIDVINERFESHINTAMLLNPKGVDLGSGREHTIWMQFEIKKNDAPIFLKTLRPDLSCADLYFWPDRWKTWGSIPEARWWKGGSGQNQKVGSIVAPFSKKYMASMDFTIADSSDERKLVNIFVSIAPQ